MGWRILCGLSTVTGGCDGCVSFVEWTHSRFIDSKFSTKYTHNVHSTTHDYVNCMHAASCFGLGIHSHTMAGLSKCNNFGFCAKPFKWIWHKNEFDTPKYTHCMAQNTICSNGRQRWKDDKIRVPWRSNGNRMGDIEAELLRNTSHSSFGAVEPELCRLVRSNHWLATKNIGIHFWILCGCVVEWLTLVSLPYADCRGFTCVCMYSRENIKYVWI